MVGSPAEIIPTLGSREALFRLSTMALMDSMVPFLWCSAVCQINELCVYPCGVFELWRGSHLEVSSHEEFASHAGQLICECW